MLTFYFSVCCVNGEINFMYYLYFWLLVLLLLKISLQSKKMLTPGVIRWLPFFAARCYASAAYAIICGVCMCLSVCVSVTFVHSVKTNELIFKIFSPSGSHSSFSTPNSVVLWCCVLYVVLALCQISELLRHAIVNAYWSRAVGSRAIWDASLPVINVKNCSLYTS